MPAKFKNVTTTGHFGFVFEENSFKITSHIYNLVPKDFSLALGRGGRFYEFKNANGFQKGPRPAPPRPIADDFESVNRPISIY